jgi:hypothetical protein
MGPWMGGVVGFDLGLLWVGYRSYNSTYQIQRRTSIRIIISRGGKKRQKMAPYRPAFFLFFSLILDAFFVSIYPELDAIKDPRDFG